MIAEEIPARFLGSGVETTKPLIAMPESRHHWPEALGLPTEIQKNPVPVPVVEMALPGAWARAAPLPQAEPLLMGQLFVPVFLAD